MVLAVVLSSSSSSSSSSVSSSSNSSSSGGGGGGGGGVVVVVVVVVVAAAVVVVASAAVLSVVLAVVLSGSSSGSGRRVAVAAVVEVVVVVVEAVETVVAAAAAVAVAVAVAAVVIIIIDSYLIIKTLAPHLLKIPFFLYRWLGPTRQLAAKDGNDIDPLMVEVRKSYPWQFDFCQTHKEMLVADLISKPLGPFSKSISKRKLAQVANTEITNSAQIKALFGLISGRALADARTLRDPDAWDTKTEFTGSFAPYLEPLGQGNGDEFAETLF